MADEDVTSTRWCSSCKHQKPDDQFETSAKTCQTCAAKKQIARRAGGQSKRRKGRATEGPEGTQWCAQKKWCPEQDFDQGNTTCNPCLQAELKRKANARNATAALKATPETDMEGWEAESLVVHDSLPTEPTLQLRASCQGDDADQKADAESGVMQVDGNGIEFHTLNQTEAEGPTAPPDEHPLTVSYTPEGTEPISDDVGSADVDNITRMLGQQLRLEGAGQLTESNAVGRLNRCSNTTDVVSVEVLCSQILSLYLLWCTCLFQIGNPCTVYGIAASQKWHPPNTVSMRGLESYSGCKTVATDSSGNVFVTSGHDIFLFPPDDEPHKRCSPSPILLEDIAVSAPTRSDPGLTVQLP